MTSTNQKINNLESAVSDLQTKSYGIRYQSGSGVLIHTSNSTITFDTVQYSINIDTSVANGFRIINSGFYMIGYHLELQDSATSGGGVFIARQTGYLFVSGPFDSYSENGSTLAYLNAGDDIYCSVWTGSITTNRGYGRSNFWIHSI